MIGEIVKGKNGSKIAESKGHDGRVTYKDVTGKKWGTEKDIKSSDRPVH